MRQFGTKVTFSRGRWIFLPRIRIWFLLFVAFIAAIAGIVSVTHISTRSAAIRTSRFALELARRTQPYPKLQGRLYGSPCHSTTHPRLIFSYGDRRAPWVDRCRTFYQLSNITCHDNVVCSQLKAKLYSLALEAALQVGYEQVAFTDSDLVFRWPPNSFMGPGVGLGRYKTYANGSLGGDPSLTVVDATKASASYMQQWRSFIEEGVRDDYAAWKIVSAPNESWVVPSHYYEHYRGQAFGKFYAHVISFAVVFISDTAVVIAAILFLWRVFTSIRSSWLIQHFGSAKVPSGAYISFEIMIFLGTLAVLFATLSVTGGFEIGSKISEHPARTLVSPGTGQYYHLSSKHNQWFQSTNLFGDWVHIRGGKFLGLVWILLYEFWRQIGVYFFIALVAAEAIGMCLFVLCGALPVGSGSLTIVFSACTSDGMLHRLSRTATSDVTKFEGKCDLMRAVAARDPKIIKNEC